MESFGAKRIDDPVKAETIAREAEEFRKGEKDMLKEFPKIATEFDYKVEDADEIAEAVVETREKAKGMSKRELEIEEWKAGQILRIFKEERISRLSQGIKDKLP